MLRSRSLRYLLLLAGAKIILCAGAAQANPAEPIGMQTRLIVEPSSFQPNDIMLEQLDTGTSLVAPAQIGITTGTAGGNPRSVLASVDIGQFVEWIEADRRLLAEIRKEVPGGHSEAEVYLARLKDLASRSDPVRLVPLVNRVLAQAPTFFSWLDKEYRTSEERVTEYYVGGARGFHFALEAFKSAVLLTVINRLDMAARLIRELNAEEP